MGPSHLHSPKIVDAFPTPQSFRPLPILVDSTRRKSLIRWQKRAAVWEHGFESRRVTTVLREFRSASPSHRTPNSGRNASKATKGRVKLFE
jgi:hypothetical protein